MKFQLLPSTFEADGSPSLRQHLACLVVNDKVAIDAGSLAMAATDLHRRELRDVVLTHAHLDHIAGLPLFVDDLFSTLQEPVRVHALQEVIDVLERDVFNWSVFPRFSELSIGKSNAMEYRSIAYGTEFEIADLRFNAFPVNHKVPSAGVLVSDEHASVAISGDTATLEGLAAAVKEADHLKAILIECAFPNELSEVARIAHHMTPNVLAAQVDQLKPQCPVFLINIKPNYRDKVVQEIQGLNIDRLEIMEVGKVYFW